MFVNTFARAPELQDLAAPDAVEGADETAADDVVGDDNDECLFIDCDPKLYIR